MSDVGSVHMSEKIEAQSHPFDEDALLQKANQAPGVFRFAAGSHYGRSCLFPQRMCANHQQLNHKTSMFPRVFEDGFIVAGFVDYFLNRWVDLVIPMYKDATLGTPGCSVVELL